MLKALRPSILISQSWSLTEFAQQSLVIRNALQILIDPSRVSGQSAVGDLNNSSNSAIVYDHPSRSRQRWCFLSLWRCRCLIRYLIQARLLSRTSGGKRRRTCEMLFIAFRRPGNLRHTQHLSIAFYRCKQGDKKSSSSRKQRVTNQALHLSHIFTGSPYRRVIRKATSRSLKIFVVGPGGIISWFQPVDTLSQSSWSHT